MANQTNRQGVNDDRDNARQDAGDEQPADAFLGQDAVDHQQDTGRDQDAQGAAGGDRAGGQEIRVAVAAHRWHRHLGHGRGGGDAGAADRSEAAAGDHRGHRQAAAEMTQEGIRGGETESSDSRARATRLPIRMKSGTTDRP